jgi:acylphosphatase
VEVAVEGPGEVVERFAEWLGHGPRGAVVQRVETTAATLPIPSEGFDILK